MLKLVPGQKIKKKKERERERDFFMASPISILSF